MHEWINIQKLVNVIYLINSLKDKDCVNIPKDAEKPWEKNPTHFHNKSTRETRDTRHITHQQKR